ncbi:uncharacterized protein PADG_11286 [Paracoccidioides brasiliensis Pb18]|uniref:Uncharacterized protein n=1 Tax=Paracoccidioides brasiliensis (strain Pb18) TaxID=502780 RepID=A0A0A0HYL9_PARBD|nr:uncharacterized protein PADG_11286 [Paracoccidioides brasiliensis Pb18]KGM92465.1 hypothetical protein PADG_11286 [Paracoccidioides brasiliensis Pb18]
MYHKPYYQRGLLSFYEVANPKTIRNQHGSIRGWLDQRSSPHSNSHSHSHSQLRMQVQKFFNQSTGQQRVVVLWSTKQHLSKGLITRRQSIDEDGMLTWARVVQEGDRTTLQLDKLTLAFWRYNSSTLDFFENSLPWVIRLEMIGLGLTMRYQRPQIKSRSLVQYFEKDTSLLDTLRSYVPR